MKPTVKILAVAIAVLAGTTTWYAQALIREKARTTSLALAVAAPGDVRGVAEQPRPGADTAVAAATQRAASSQQQQSACPDTARIAAGQQRLLQFTDPAQRLEQYARTREGLARTWKTIAMSMQLPEAQLDPLLDVLSTQRLRSDQRRAECQADPQCPPCDPRALEDSLREDRIQNLAGHLGPAWMSRYDAYVYAITERVYMDTLRAHLTGARALGDAEAERLVLALADERRQFIAHAAALGKRVKVGGAGFNVQEFDGDSEPPPFGPSNWEMTAEFNARIDRVAAAHLQPAQLAAFQSMQKERLANARLMEQLAR